MTTTSKASRARSSARVCSSRSSATTPSWAGTAPAPWSAAASRSGVRLVDLAGAERLARRAKLGAGHEDRDARAPGAAHLRDPGGGERGDLARAEQRPGLEDDLARPDVPAAPAHVRARRHRLGDDERPVAAPRRPRAGRPRRPRPAPSRRSRCERPSPGEAARRAGCPAAASPTQRERPGRVGASEAANPSIAELGKGGRSVVESAGSARTRPAARSIGTRSGSSGRARSRTSRWASSTEIRSGTDRA